MLHDTCETDRNSACHRKPKASSILAVRRLAASAQLALRDVAAPAAPAVAGTGAASGLGRFAVATRATPGTLLAVDFGHSDHLLPRHRGS